MANLIITITKGIACANRIGDVLDLDEERIQSEKVSISGGVEFRNVTAQYAKSAEAALEGISFRAEPGQTIGVIGGTGSGKSTLVNLIPKLYDAAGGEILLDGVPVSKMEYRTLRSQIGIVPQKAVLFSGSIRENLRWGREDVTDEELWEALDLAQARQVVEDKDGALDARVEQGGTNFSGGQRQRLTIARALVRKPKILIMDDSASALDYATDAALRQAIRGMEAPPTTFIVSQRAASVRFADLILVLDDGMLVGKGTHEELLDSCAVYQEIYHTQFRKAVGSNG